MNYIKKNGIGNIVRHSGMVALLVVAVLGTLYVGEAAFPREALVPTASAWNCQSMTANPSTITRGDSSTLAWKFSNDNGITVTIDQIPGETWNGVQGSTDVSPTETTTYIARAHKVGTSQTLTCSTKVTVTEPEPEPAPDAVCTLTADKTTIEKGESVTLTWTSEHAVSAVLTGIGAIALNDSLDVTPEATTTYTATFKNEDGKEVSCEKTVFVTPKSTPTSTSTPTQAPTASGGGGPCRNCGSSSNSGGSSHSNNSGGGSTPTKTVSPNIVLSSTVTSAPYVYLSQVPYTGFTAGPVLTAVFWFAVLTLSALIAYVMTVPRPLSGFASLTRLIIGKKEEEKEKKNVFALNTVSVAGATFAPIVIQPEEYTALLARDISGMTGNNADDLIEEQAQKDHILLSPEALRMVAQEAEHSSLDSETLYTAIFDEAKAMYPREDGWILLSKERINVVLAAMQQGGVQTKSNNTTVRAQAAPAPQAQTRQEEARVPYSAAMTYREAAPKTQPVTAATTATQDVAPVLHKTQEVPVADFVALLESGQQQKAFEILRALSAQGKAEQYIKSLVRGLDDVYKNRIEGGRTPTAELARATATWSNNDFEAVLGMLIESVDWSYSSARVGTKIALAKAFEYFEGKKSKQA